MAVDTTKLKVGDFIVIVSTNTLMKVVSDEESLYLWATDGKTRWKVGRSNSHKYLRLPEGSDELRMTIAQLQW